MGLGGGLTFPAMNVLIAEWAPRQERSTMSSLVYGGNQGGNISFIFLDLIVRRKLQALLWGPSCPYPLLA